MEREKHLRRLLLLVIFLPSWLFGQGEYRCRIYDAYVSGDMDAWRQTVEAMELQPPSGTAERLELIGYCYGYIGYLLGKGENAEAGKWIGKGETQIARVLETDPGHPTALAFRGAFLGFGMALNKFRSVTTGPESLRCINRAVKSDPDNVQALVEKANLLRYAPVVFGGDRKKAAEYYRRAIARIEQTEQRGCDWFYLNLLALLGELYLSEGRPDEAVRMYRKALVYEPEFRWVRDELWPRALESLEK